MILGEAVIQLSSTVISVQPKKKDYRLPLHGKGQETGLPFVHVLIEFTQRLICVLRIQLPSLLV